MRVNSTQWRRQTIVRLSAPTTVVLNDPQPSQERVREDARAKEFAALVIPFSAEDLSSASGRSPEAAKLWKKGKRFPNGDSLLELGRTIPVIRSWIFAELDSAAPANGSALNAVVAGLQLVAQQPTAEGAQARAMLAQIGARL